MVKMSQNMDDSPNSDNKMDISEPTISQESFGLSPECDDHKTTPIIRADSTEFAATIGITTNASFTASNESGEHACPALNRPTAPAQCSPPSNRSSPTKRRHTNAEPNDNKLADSSSSLDNRLTTCTNKTKIVNSKQRTDWTLVDMHPLMPNDAESPDSPPMDASHAFAGIAADRTAPEEAATAPPPERPAEWQTTASPLAAQPDLLEVATAKGSAMTSSGESEPDLSQYEASVEPTYQSVSMTNHNSAGGPSGLAVPKASHLRRISLTSELRSKFDDDSSIDTASNNSFDGDDSDANDDFGAKRDGKQPKVGESRPNADSPAASSSRDGGAAAKDASNAVTLSDGRTRDIDMKVIEPYKRCLSHGGYIQSPGNNAIVIFSACYLPDRSRADYNYVMDNLFLYVVKTLDQFVTDDYILIYLHGGSTRSTLPPLPWLKKCYYLLNRRIRKSLKNLYMVHPTIWLKSIVWMARPFISTKFWRKLVYIRTLDDLYEKIPVERAAVPEKVKLYDRGIHN